MLTQFKLFTSSAVIAVLLLSGCDGSVRREGRPQAQFEVVRTDAARNRLWVLDPRGLTLYDNTNGRRLRQVVLPELFLAGAEHTCRPDVAFDAAGTVFVSSDVLPVLWRVDPQGFEVTRIEFALESDADKDVGFTALAFAGDGTLLAAGTTFASLWRLDLRSARASKIASYASAIEACHAAQLLRAAARN